MASSIGPASRTQSSSRRSDVPTIYDVARLAQVNPSTVSRALRQQGRASATTTAPIRAAAEGRKLGVRTVPVLRAELASGRRGTGAARAIAGWIACEAREGATSAGGIHSRLARLDDALAADDEVVEDVRELAAELSATAATTVR